MQVLETLKLNSHPFASKDSQPKHYQSGISSWNRESTQELAVQIKIRTSALRTSSLVQARRI